MHITAYCYSKIAIFLIYALFSIELAKLTKLINYLSIVNVA